MSVAVVDVRWSETDSDYDESESEHADRCDEADVEEDVFEWGRAELKRMCEAQPGFASIIAPRVSIVISPASEPGDKEVHRKQHAEPVESTRSCALGEEEMAVSTVLPKMEPAATCIRKADGVRRLSDVDMFSAASEEPSEEALTTHNDTSERTLESLLSQLEASRNHYHDHHQHQYHHHRDLPHRQWQREREHEHESERREEHYLFPSDYRDSGERRSTYEDIAMLDDCFAVSDTDGPEPTVACGESDLVVLEDMSTAAVGGVGVSALCGERSGEGCDAERDECEGICPVCEESDVELAHLSCGHVCCVHCVQRNLQGQIGIGRLKDLSCPMSRTCLLDEDTIREQMPQEDYEQLCHYRQVLLGQTGSDFRWCPTPDCNTMCPVVKDAIDARMQCMKCESEFCRDCANPWHPDVSCKTYRKRVLGKVSNEEKEFSRYRKRSRSRECPKCGAIVHKTQGCNLVTCRCGAPFCYLCGEEANYNHFFRRRNRGCRLVTLSRKERVVRTLVVGTCVAVGAVAAVVVVPVALVTAVVGGGALVVTSPLLLAGAGAGVAYIAAKRYRRRKQRQRFVRGARKRLRKR